MKRILCVLLAMAVTLLFLPMTVFAVSPSVQAAITTGAVGEIIDVPVMLTDNPGIISIGLDIRYDLESLRLKEVRNGELFEQNTMTTGNDQNSVPYTVLWDDPLANNHSQSGTLAVLRFEILPEAKTGISEIWLSVHEGSVFNASLEKVNFSTVNGAICVTKGQLLKSDTQAVSAGNQIEWLYHKKRLSAIASQAKMMYNRYRTGGMTYGSKSG